MNILVKKVSGEDRAQLQLLSSELYAQLGEDRHRVANLAEKFADQLINEKSCLVLAVKSFVTREIISLVTLTESKAIGSCGRYGVLDELFTRPGFKTTQGLDLASEIRSIATNKGWGRIDIAAPTDAWHRTVRFYKHLHFRLTVPKYKLVLDLSKAA